MLCLMRFICRVNRMLVLLPHVVLNDWDHPSRFVLCDVLCGCLNVICKKWLDVYWFVVVLGCLGDNCVYCVLHITCSSTVVYDFALVCVSICRHTHKCCLILLLLLCYVTLTVLLS
jgi:hypothetical protein